MSLISSRYDDQITIILLKILKQNVFIIIIINYEKTIVFRISVVIILYNLYTLYWSSVNLFEPDRYVTCSILDTLQW